MLSKYITKLLKIYPHDIPRLISLSILNMLLISLHSFGASIVTSLFIKRYGVDYLPKMYLISPCVIVICTLLVLKLGNIKRNTLLTASCALFGTLVIAARILLQFDITIACPLLYVLADFMTLFFYTQFWALAVDVCDVREGKRIFTYVVCAGLIGGGLAGAGVNLLAQKFGNNELLTLWAVLFFAVALYIKRTVHEPAPSGDEAESSFTGQLKDTAFYFTRSGHVRILMTCVVLAIMSGNLLDFVFNKIMDRTFTDESRLTAFYGTYSLLFYSGTLIIQLFITNRAVKSLGTGNSLLLLPVSVTLGFGSLTAAFGYVTGVCTKFCKDVISASFSDSVYPLLFSPLKENIRNSILAITEGLVTPLGTACAGGVLLLLSDKSDLAVVSTSLAFASLWVYAGVRLKKSYQSAFISNLAAKSLPDISTIKDMGNMSEGQVLSLLAHALRSEDDHVSYFAMRSLTQSGDIASTDLLVHYLNENPASGRKANLLYFLGGLKENGTYLAVVEGYLADPDPLVRAKAASAFLSANEPRVRDRILPLVHDTDLRVRINAVMVLWKFGIREEYLAILASAVNDTSEHIRSWAGFALRQIQVPESIPLLLELSHDSSLKVKIEAIKGLRRLDGEAANTRLIELLYDGNRKVRRSAYKSLIGKENIANLLIQQHETCRLEKREQLVYILAARREGQDIVFRYLENELHSIYKRIVWITVLRREQQTPAIELFIATLINRNRRALDKLLKISSCMEGSAAFGLVVKRLKDKDPRAFAEALELLDTMTLHKRSFLKSIISLLEGIPENELAGYAHKELGIREYSVDDIYKECLQDPAEEWFKGCALFILSSDGHTRNEAVFREHLRSGSLFIQEVCNNTLNTTNPQPEA